MSNLSLSQKFVAGLNEKFAEDGLSYSVISGRKYDKVVVEAGSRSVYVFIDKATGDLYKPASWRAPAKGVRYSGDELLTVALDHADRFGGFTYFK